MLCLCFFFQAEDGIRSGHVTGVQTCALPILVEALRAFTGLPHRCQWVAQHAGVDYFNDSKATNVGATLAAIEGLAADYPQLVLIAGGEGKGADFAPLASAVQSHVRAAVLMGADAPRLADALSGAAPVVRAADMPNAVRQASAQARSGDAVLLSPACASFDMFSNYEDRGRAFCAAVKELSA